MAQYKTPNCLLMSPFCAFYLDKNNLSIESNHYPWVYNDAGGDPVVGGDVRTDRLGRDALKQGLDHRGQRHQLFDEHGRYLSDNDATAASVTRRLDSVFQLPSEANVLALITCCGSLPVMTIFFWPSCRIETMASPLGSFLTV